MLNPKKMGEGGGLLFSKMSEVAKRLRAAHGPISIFVLWMIITFTQFLPPKMLLLH